MVALPVHPEWQAVRMLADVARPGVLTVVRLPGLTPYLPMWERQQALAAARARGDIGDLLLLLEHPHVFTNGRRGDRAHLLADEAELARIGAVYLEVDRGGDITYHGPGQLVGYGIIHLEERKLGVREYVRGLERALIQTVAHFGVLASAVPGYTGVWVGNEKIVAIGVRVTRGVAYHGFALNVDPDLSYFARIIPCGIPDRGVTSLARLTGTQLTVDDVAPVCARELAAMLDMPVQWVGEGVHWGLGARG